MMSKADCSKSSGSAIYVCQVANSPPSKIPQQIRSPNPLPIRNAFFWKSENEKIAPLVINLLKINTRERFLLSLNPH